MKKLIALLVVVFALFVLVGCTPKDQVAAKEKMEGKDYKVVVDGTIQPAALKLLGVEGVESVLTATKTVENKDGEKETIALEAIFFDTADHAKAALKTIQEEAKKNGEKSEVKQAGKWLYYGSDQAVKDFK